MRFREQIGICVFIFLLEYVMPFALFSSNGNKPDLKKADTIFESEKTALMEELLQVSSSKNKDTQLAQALPHLEKVHISLQDYLDYLRTIIYYEKGQKIEPTIDIHRIKTVSEHNADFYTYICKRYEELKDSVTTHVDEKGNEKERDLTSLEIAYAFYRDFLLFIANTYVYYENEAKDATGQNKSKRRNAEFKMKIIRNLFTHVYEIMTKWKAELDANHQHHH